jgi:methyl-accepting chemotaxis protein
MGHTRSEFIERVLQKEEPMFKRHKLGTKLVMAFLAVGLIPFAVVGVTSLMKAGGSLSVQAFGQLESVREIKKTQLEQYFANRRADLDMLKETVEALRRGAFEKLESVQELKKAQVEEYFTKVRADVLALSKSDDIHRMVSELWKHHDKVHTGPSDPYDTASDEYRRLAETYGASLENFVKVHGYYDLFVICAPHGHVMHTVAKEPDLGANLGHGPYKDEALASLWKKVVATKALAIEDFSPYSPSQGQQAAFIGAPILEPSGAVQGVVALQLPTEPINRIAQKRNGMGRTGETYLVGKQGEKIALRSDMKTMGDGKYVIGHEFKTQYIEEALSGKEAQDVYTDSAGNLVLVAYDPLKIEGLTWACISKMDLDEAIAPRSDGDEKDYYARYVERYGYYDLFLIHPKGKVFYSVTHEPDYGTNMVDGEYAGSGLGRLVRKVLETRQYGVADFAPYAPSNNEPAAFIAEPIIRNGQVQLIVALQLSLEAINGVMQQRAGMGKTGETWDGENRHRKRQIIEPEIVPNYR